ncbi:unnamed protein product [Darwinula stevensoni]|uniref:Uncharacterized protein n=1 Tax=Darwinula stevensoni TaxID=69355 RepID=A0A7R9FQF1_9CRUS|nr:unnamed protein product [Darwinula stevensoni]CAG0899657.1 unnamed protein product [Darwinula stevensoni]
MYILAIKSGQREKGRQWNKLEDLVSGLLRKTEEHAKLIAQLKNDCEHLWHEKENLKLDNENLKSSLLENIRDRDEIKLELNSTEGRLQYLEAVNQQIRGSTTHKASSSIRAKGPPSLTPKRACSTHGIRMVAPRTCQALADLGVTRSGTYHVDPDGSLIGDAPTLVFCDMETTPVSTIVLHDSMGNTEIDPCGDPGCYRRNISYGSSMKQMVALIEQSESCEQQIRYDCFMAALTTGLRQYGWWVDRHGDPQYYWDGSNAGEHVCRCGISNDCIGPPHPCNCDAKAPQWESDVGAIMNGTALPITELHFGGLKFDDQRANYTLGALTCRGKAPSSANPVEPDSSLHGAGSTSFPQKIIDSAS